MFTARSTLVLASRNVLRRSCLATKYQPVCPSRPLSTSDPRRSELISTDPGITAVSSQVYVAPLYKTVRNIKVFSLSSLAVATFISPVFFIIEADLEIAIRGIMVGLALGSSAISTAVIQWVLKPYVIEGRYLNSIGQDKVELYRLSILGRKKPIVLHSSDLTVDKNGRMFSNLKTQDGDCFYIHETTKFWKDLTKDLPADESTKQV